MAPDVVGGFEAEVERHCKEHTAQVELQRPDVDSVQPQLEAHWNKRALVEPVLTAGAHSEQASSQQVSIWAR